MSATNLFNSFILTVGLLVSATARGSAQEPGNERPATTEEREAFGGAWSYPNYRVYDRPLVELRQYQEDLNALPEPNKVSRDSATIVAHVPANAKISFNGQLTSSTGATRIFHTPTLTQPDGFVYSYDIQISWDENGKPMSQNQTLIVGPGKEFSVSLMDSKGKSEPKSVVAAKVAERQDERALTEKQR